MVMQALTEEGEGVAVGVQQDEAVAEAADASTVVDDVAISEEEAASTVVDDVVIAGEEEKAASLALDGEWDEVSTALDDSQSTSDSVAQQVIAEAEEELTKDAAARPIPNPPATLLQAAHDLAIDAAESPNQPATHTDATPTAVTVQSPKTVPQPSPQVQAEARRLVEEVRSHMCSQPDDLCTPPNAAAGGVQRV